MKAGRSRWFGLVIGGLLLASSARAAVVTVAYYRLGEDDPNAVAGQPTADTLINSGGGVNLGRVGAVPAYSSDTGVAGSLLALEVSGGGYTNSAPLVTVADNWGIEAWVYAESTEQARCIVYNGTSSNSGMGLYQVDGNFVGLLGGVAFVGSEPIVPGVWMHLAVVVMNGSTTLYVNGVPIGSAGAPRAATGAFHLGIRADSGEPFLGRIDEVRLFTFAPDAFTPDDLLLSKVPPDVQAPTIVSGPTASPSPRVLAGDALSLSVVAGGTGPLSYQWGKGGVDLAGATNATFSIGATAVSDAGDYRVVVTSPHGTVTSDVITLAILPPGSPSLTTVAYYRLGEDDPGAAAGSPAADPAQDSNGSLDLAQIGNPPTYVAETGITGSTLGVAVDGGGYSYPGLLFTDSDHWGLEAWVASDTTEENRRIAYHGSSNGRGMGIYQLGDRFVGLAGGVAVVGGATVTPGAWTHLAIVTAGGTTTFYVNGQSTGTGGRPNPTDPTQDTFSLGIDPDLAEPFVGRIDEVRLFTVLAGHFTVGDLLLSRVPPGALPPFVVSGPTVTPGNQLLSGSSFTLSMVAGGAAPLEYQWRKAATDLAGATNASLTITNAAVGDSGAYDVVIRNLYGAATSAVVNVSVVLPGTPTAATVAYYRLGEQDPGAVADGVGANLTMDAEGDRDLTQIGNPPIYLAATGVTGSTLCIAVDNGGYWLESAILTENDNWGVEAWVQSDTTEANRCIVYNGNSSNSGMGLYQIGDRYQGLIGGVAFVGGAPITTGAWTHLALVASAGTTTFYVNGVSTGTAGRPNPATAELSEFQLGMKGDGAEAFLGRIDEVRLFTVTFPGQFSTDDLLLTRVPPQGPAPAVAIGIAAGKVVFTWTAGQLQQADTLAGPWTVVGEATSPWSLTPTGAMKFFRAVVP